MPSVQITDDNPALQTLARSWVTASYSGEDGIGPMESLHEAGDSLVAVALLDDEDALTVLGSGVMIGPGLAVVATHVLDEFTAQNAKPILLTFLPDGARAWLPRQSSTVSGPSAFGPHRRVVSDISLLSCTLNSEAHEHRSLMLAPLQIALPLVGERLWAFGYRHGALEGNTGLVTPLVASGLVSAAFPHGRGERMPSSCVEVAMDTTGGMSGGPVVNASGDLVGIVSSSFEGGPSYVTLIWEALRLKVATTLPDFADSGEIDLFAARALGLVKLKGKIRRTKRGNVTMTLSDPEAELMAVSLDPSKVVMPQPGSTFLVDSQLDDFEERWLPDVEAAASEIALAHLEALALPSLHRFLAASDVPERCLTPIRKFTVQDFEGLEDPDLLSAAASEDTVAVNFAFDLLSVAWTVQVPAADYLALADDYNTHFINITVNGSTASMELYQRCHFEADLTLDLNDAKITQASITFSAVIRRRSTTPRSLRNRAIDLS